MKVSVDWISGASVDSSAEKIDVMLAVLGPFTRSVAYICSLLPGRLTRQWARRPASSMAL